MVLHDEIDRVDNGILDVATLFKTADVCGCHESRSIFGHDVGLVPRVRDALHATDQIGLAEGGRAASR